MTDNLPPCRVLLRSKDGIEVFPVNPIVPEIGAYQQMRVVATYADGRKRDVTREAFVESLLDSGLAALSGPYDRS